MGNELAVATEVYTKLTESLEKQVAALPKNFNKARFVQNCMTVLQEDANLTKCEPRSLVRTLLKGAFLGLDFFNKECYAIPYGNKAQFQTDYTGETKLCKIYSVNPIKDIYAKIVRESDFFEEEIKAGQQYINYKPLPFNNGKILGAFAVCLFKDGSMIYDTMSSDEIEQTRKNYSKMPNGQAWKKSTGEMYKKTVLRRLCKLIELDFETLEQKKIFEEAGKVEFKNEKEPAVDIFDTTYTEESDGQATLEGVANE
jgi:recombination protein RecT